MTEQTEGNESNTTVASRAKDFQDLVHAGVKDALAGDAASMDAFEKAISGPQSLVMELAILAIAQNDAGLEGVFDVSVATAVSSAVAKGIQGRLGWGWAISVGIGALAGEGVNIPLSNTETGQAANEWAEKWWGEALAQPTNFAEPASEAAFDQGVSDWMDKWGEALIEQPLMFPENVDDSESVAEAIGNWFDQWGEALFKEPIRFPDGSGEASIFDAFSDFFQDALNWLPSFDPLTLDLDGDGDGIETLPADGTVLCDHTGDGIKQGAGWVAPDDGLLVLDKNGNGLIDNGNELFGDNTVKADGSLALNGFDALADYDSNGDGRIDAGDAEFASLRIWQDSNSDGVSQSDELITLAAAGVAAINLDSMVSTQNVGNNNFANAVGTFERLDGSASTLSAAAASSAVLAATLTQYSSASTREAQSGLLDQLLADWADSADFDDFVERLDAASQGYTDALGNYHDDGGVDVVFKLTTEQAHDELAFDILADDGTQGASSGNFLRSLNNGDNYTRSFLYM